MNESSEKNVLSELERMLVAALLPPKASGQLATGRIAKEFLAPVARRITALSANYVAGEAGHFDAEDARAYALYYLPLNFRKVRALLEDLPHDYRHKSLEVLDFGCGPGTATLAAQSVLDPRCTYTLLDASGAMADTARALIARSPWTGASCTVHRGSSIPDKKFNLIMAANVLSELGAGASLELIETMREHLTSNGVLMLLEPGSQEITRSLMTLRDIVVTRFADMQLHFPCTRNDLCPMLASSPDDWCHGTLSWEPPQIVRQLDELTEFNKHRLKFSAMVFIRNGALRNGYRVVANPCKVHRGLAIPICGPEVYGAAIVPKKLPSEVRHTARRIGHYDLIRIRGMDEQLEVSGELEKIQPLTFFIASMRSSSVGCE